MAIITNVQTTRLCPQCGQVRPIDWFRRVRRNRDDLRHSVCRICKNQVDRHRKLLQRRRKLSKGLTALRQTQDPKRLEVLAAALIESCGGVTRMMELAKECLADPGRSGFKAQLTSTTIDLVEKVEKQCPQSPRERYDEMSDKELEISLHRHLEKMIRNKPTIAVEVLRQHGWVVRPPEQ